MRRSLLTATALGLLLLPLVLLHDFRGAGFVADDFYFSTVEIDLRPGHLLGSAWGHLVVPGTVGYRPLTLLSFGVNQRLSGRDPTGYRLTNYLMHGAVCALLALLAWSVSGLPAVGILAGVLFAVHPIHHENVLWIAGRTHVLAALFILTALWWVHTGCARSRVRQDLVGVGLFVLAVWSYEPAVILPVALLPVAFVRAGGHDRERVATAARIVLPYVLVLGAYLLFRWLYLTAATADLNAYTLERVFRNALAAGARLLTVTKETPWPVWTFWSVGVTLVVTTLALRAGWQDRRFRGTVLAGLALGVLFFGSFIAADRYVDRFAYLTSAGFVMALSAGIVAMLSAARRRGARTALAVIVGLMMGLWTTELRRAGRDWHEAGHLARHGGVKVEFTSQPPVFRLQLPRTTLASGHSAVELLRSQVHTRLVGLMGESTPGPTKSVTLSDQRDRFGDPFAHVHYEESDFDLETYRFGRDVFERLADGTRAIGRTFANAGTYSSGHHHLGTCRMGLSAADSVTDRLCRVHGVPNLFVVGGANFASAGAVNPTLTMVALGVRVAGTIVEQLRSEQS